MGLIFFGNIRCRHIFGRQRRYLHCNIGKRLLNSIIYHIRSCFHDNADSSAAMYVRNYAAFRCNYFFKSSDIQIFADYRYFFYQSFFYGLGSVFFPFFRHKSINVCRIGTYCLSRHCFYEILEICILSHKVGL